MPRLVRRVLAAVVAAGALAVSGCGNAGDGAVRGAMPRPLPVATVAFLRAASSPDAEAQQRALLEELHDAGYVVGESLELLSADPTEVHPDPGEASDLTREWADQGVDLIFALSTEGARLAGEAAPEVPILFISNDPVATGLVADERRPDGHLTGVTFSVPADRLVDLARQIVPGADTVGILSAEGDMASQPAVDAALDAAESLDLDATAATFAGEGSEAVAVARLAEAGADVVLLTSSPTLARRFGPIQSALADLRLPAVASTSGADRAVVILQPDTIELYRQLGRQAVRILEGVAVSEVPVEDPGRYRLVVNASVAEELGLTVPPSLLERADRIVENQPPN